MEFWSRLLGSPVAFMRWQAFGRKERPIGVDIGTSSVKLVDLSHDTSEGLPRWRLQGADRVTLPADVLDADGTVRDVPALVQLLKPAVQARGWRGRNAVAAMPWAGVTVRRLQVPEGLSDRDLELEVQLQLEPLLPYPLALARLDFVCESDTAVRAVAAPRAAVDSRRAVLEQSGLRVVAMDLASDALRRAATRAPHHGLPEGDRSTRHPGVTAVIDIGVQAARIQVLWGERVLHEREQPGLGVQSLQSMSPWDGAQALSSALNLFFDGRVHGLQDILLCGAAARRAGLAPALQTHHLCNCEVLRPFAGMHLAGHVDRGWLGLHAAALSTACGLALRGAPEVPYPSPPSPTESATTSSADP